MCIYLIDMEKSDSIFYKEIMKGIELWEVSSEYNWIISDNVYKVLQRGMNLREMADYKESYSQSGASNLIEMVIESHKEIEKELFKA